MKVLSVIVKGDRHQAAQAASSRSIPFAFQGEVQHPQTTVGHVGLQHRDAVTRWFCEAPNAAPFPVGTMLLFTPVEATR